VVRHNHEREQAKAFSAPSAHGGHGHEHLRPGRCPDNAALLDSGITHIRLTKLEWTRVSLSGDRASANTVETWRATNADGHS
jgi:hypothetical protein